MLNLKKLAQLMAEQGVNNRMLSCELNVTEQMIHYIVNGKRIPSLALYTDMCKFFDVSLDTFIL